MTSSLLAGSMDFYYAQQAGTRTANGDDYDPNAIVEGGDTVGEGAAGSGGFFDAGDHVKFIKPQAQTLYELAAGYEEGNYGESSDELLDQLVHGATFLMSLLDGQADGEMIVQVGDAKIDHSNMGGPEGGDGTIFSGSMADHSEIAALASAALFKISNIFEQEEANGTLPETAPDITEMRASATTFLEYAGQDTDMTGTEMGTGKMGGFYDNHQQSSADEMIAAYVEAYKATGDEEYYRLAMETYTTSQAGSNIGTSGYDWDNLNARSTLSLLRVATEKGDTANVDILNGDMEAGLDAWVENEQDGFISLHEGHIWGNARHNANMGAVLLDYSKYLAENEGDEIKIQSYVDSAYRIYDRLTDYVTGNEGGPMNPHHRRADNLDGTEQDGGGGDMIGMALVGGPSDGNAESYTDTFEDYVQNEVAIDYNAGWSSMLALMQDPALATYVENAEDDYGTVGESVFDSPAPEAGDEADTAENQTVVGGETGAEDTAGAEDAAETENGTEVEEESDGTEVEEESDGTEEESDGTEEDMNGENDGDGDGDGDGGECNN